MEKYLNLYSGKQAEFKEINSGPSLCLEHFPQPSHGLVPDKKKTQRSVTEPLASSDTNTLSPLFPALMGSWLLPGTVLRTAERQLQTTS